MKKRIPLIFVVVLLLSFTVTSSAFKDPYPQFFHNQLLVYQEMGGDITVKQVVANQLTGNSMSPTLPHGSTLLFQSSDNIVLQPGMIVHYVHEGNNVVHRIIAVYEDHIILQGDNNNDQDYFLFSYEKEVPKTAVKHIVVGVLFT